MQSGPAPSPEPLTVSALAQGIKTTLEGTYSHIRVRGELSGVKVVGSGHMYGDIKDADSAINIVCWKGTLARLSIRPEDGMDVILTGKVTSYPKNSRYQVSIQSIELAGEGALLKLLEERKRKLAAEGLFDETRKKRLPFLPETIGVVTSPTGAVIRDIMHRLADRFPRRVLLWPVLVQGAGAAEQISAAIGGFSNLPADGPVPRPDVLIVARGGGSLEDLMAFNEENVVRAVAACPIPLISAIGHETDTTLIDYAADLRAPTPTGAAEMAVPRRVDLLYTVAEAEKRMLGGVRRLLSEKRARLETAAARLGDPDRMMETRVQTLDHLSHKLDTAFQAGLSVKRARAEKAGAMLRHPRHVIEEASRKLGWQAEGLLRVRRGLTEESRKSLDHAARMLDSLSFHRVLERGFVVVRDSADVPVTGGKALQTGQGVTLQFHDKPDVKAIIGSGGKPVARKGKTDVSPDQGQLF